MMKSGDWLVVERRSYGSSTDYAAAQFVSATAKMAVVEPKVLHRISHPLGSLIPVSDEAAARLLVERLTSVQAERNRRITAARQWAVTEAEKLIDAARIA